MNHVLHAPDCLGIYHISGGPDNYGCTEYAITLEDEGEGNIRQACSTCGGVSLKEPRAQFEADRKGQYVTSVLKTDL